MPHVRVTGDYFRAQLEWLKAQHGCVLEVRGLGLMLGMELDSADAAKQVVSQLMQRGILINRTHETVLRFLPPYIIEKKHVDLVIRELNAAISSGSSIGASRKAQKSTARIQS